MAVYDNLPASAATDFNPLTGGFTIEAFVYLEGLGVSIASKRNTGASDNPGWHFFTNVSGTLGATFCDGSASKVDVSSNSAVGLNEWVRLGAVFDRDGDCTLYINGVADGGGDISTQPASTSNDEDFDIGKILSVYFNGLISEIRYSSTARTTMEMYASYTDGFIIDTNTVSLWRPDKDMILRDVANGNDMTHIDNSGNNYSHIVYMPRDEGIIDRDVSLTPIRYSGKVKYNSELSSTCGDFDGTNDYVDCGNDSNLDFYDGSGDLPFSISAWIYIDTAADFEILSRYNASSARGYIFHVDVDSYFRFFLSSEAAYVIGRESGEQLYSFNLKWSHVCATYDGSEVSSGVKLYMDGIRVDGYDYTVGSYSGLSEIDESTYIGRRQSTYSNGKMCDVRIFDTELTSAEVLNVMNGGINGTEVGYWPLSEGNGLVVHDVSGNNNHGSVENATLSTFWAPTQTKFHYNLYKGFSDGLYFDGTAQGLGDGTNPKLNPSTNPFTIEAIVQSMDYSNGYSAIFLNWDSFSDVFGFWIDSSGRLRLSATANSISVINAQSNTGVLTDGNIHYIAVTYIPSEAVEMYVDGSVVPVTVSINTGADISPNGNIIIGHDAVANYFTGNMYKVRYSNKARTADDVLNTYNNGMVVDEYTVALWDFKNGEGVDIAGGVQGQHYTIGTGTNLTMTNTEHVRMPALSTDLTLDAFSQPIEHLAGKWHNNAETTIDFTGGISSALANNIYEGHGVFNGSTAYVDCGDQDEFSFGDGSTDDPFSISAWINMDDSVLFNIVTKRHEEFLDYTKVEWSLFTDTGGALYFSMWQAGGEEPYGIDRRTATLNGYEGEWIHVCGTYDGGGDQDTGIKIYVNGVRVDVESSGTGASYTAMANTSQPVEIGRYIPGAGDPYYADGKIRDVRIYGGELTAAEVNVDYKVGDIVKTHSLIAEYKLYKDAKDSGANNFHGINTDVTFPKVTLPTSYSFGDPLARPMYKKIIGNNVLKATAGSFIFLTPSNNVYGIWEFDIYVNDGVSGFELYFMSSQTDENTDNAYYVLFSSNGLIDFQKVVSGGWTQLAITDTGYFNNEQWYNVKIVRNETLNQYVSGATGTFAIYIDGEILDLSGGSGSMPVTDNALTTSKYLFFFFGYADDRIRNLKFNGELMNLSKFTPSSNTYTITGNRESNFVGFEREYKNQSALRPIYKYAETELEEDTPALLLTTTTSSSTSTSTTSSSTSTTSSSTTSTTST